MGAWASRRASAMASCPCNSASFSGADPHCPPPPPHTYTPLPSRHRSRGKRRHLDQTLGREQDGLGCRVRVADCEGMGGWGKGLTGERPM
eukprot:63471-Rhodomonas_salina.1